MKNVNLIEEYSVQENKIWTGLISVLVGLKERNQKKKKFTP